jgi:hypothetical protein
MRFWQRYGCWVSSALTAQFALAERGGQFFEANLPTRQSGIPVVAFQLTPQASEQPV